jgi:glycosyltransferase involved in cell wall biosynthesis
MTEKGLPDISAAFVQLARANTDWRLVLVGHLTRLPPELDSLRHQTIMTGVVRNRERLAEVYAAADVLAVPSAGRDQTPCTISEALSCGTPVVAYDVGAISEMFGPTHGRLITKGDITALTDSLIAVVETSDATTRQSASDFAAEMYGAEKATNRYLQVYNDAIAASRPRSNGDRDRER